MARLRWQQANGRRHAHVVTSGADAPRLDVIFRSLCGVCVAPGARDLHKLGGNWLDPTCRDCEHIWIRAMNDGRVNATGEIVRELVEA